MSKKILLLGLWILQSFAFADMPMVKLTPKIRVESVKNAENLLTPTLKLHLTPSLILNDKKQFADAPYILAESDGQEQGGTGVLIFVKGLHHLEDLTYSIYGEGKAYQHPVTGENLGYEMIPAGEAMLTKLGTLSELVVTKALEPIEVGMRIFPAYALNLPTKIRFIPAVKDLEEGYILAGHQAIDEIGINYTVVLSLGERDGVVEGNYLDIYQNGKTITDPSSKSWRKKMIQLPDKRIGRLLVYQVYEKLSLGIVTEATEIVHVLDKVKSP